MIIMGVTLSGLIFVYGDKLYVVHNTQWHESALKKKSNSIFYHTVRESAAMGGSIMGHVPSVENPADICTKVLPGEQRHSHFLIRLLLHYFCDCFCDCVVFLIILLSEEVCGSWGFTCYMGN
jgi:hypothetical protein